jgi:hypothetical protein
MASEVGKWTSYMQNKTGGVFFVLGAYTDEDGGLCIARSVHSMPLEFDTILICPEGMRRVSSTSLRREKSIGKVPITFSMSGPSLLRVCVPRHRDIPADTSRHLEKEEREDDDENLEVDEDGYPSLPSDVITLRLSKKKSIVRLFMGAIRRM